MLLVGEVRFFGGSAVSFHTKSVWAAIAAYQDAVDGKSLEKQNLTALAYCCTHVDLILMLSFASHLGERRLLND